MAWERNVFTTIASRHAETLRMGDQKRVTKKHRKRQKPQTAQAQGRCVFPKTYLLKLNLSLLSGLYILN